MKRASLRLRLFVSYATVVAAGATTVVVVTRFLVPRLFDSRVGRLGLRYGRGSGATSDPGVHSALVAALNTALLAALVASLVVAAVAATLVARRLLRSLEDFRRAARRLAEGHYDQPVPVPPEPELAALAADVNGLAARLAESERRRAELIGDVAHEMRTPLTSIGGYVEGLADGMFTAEETVAAVTDELERLQRLAADLAEVSRAEEGGPTLVLRDEDLAEIARAVVDRLRPQFADKGVSLILDALVPVPIRVDRDRMVQAVTNVIGNALAYTPPAGTVTVAVTAQPTGGGRLTVTDTGRGLTAGDTERVFERFYRVDRGRRTGGSGIGLTIARSIVRAHGGDIVATSSGPGSGATFTLTLLSPPDPGRL